MTELILHHYEVSPFAEKVRAILGYKQLAWRAVEIPVVMPKPNLVALTGGYRKTPVLQIGSDVYCDTALIARVLDARFPERPVFRPDQDALSVAAGRWFDRELFLAVVGQFAVPAYASATAATLGGPAAAMAFFQDRTRMMTGVPARPPRPGDGRATIEGALERLEAQLSGAAPFLLGASPAWVDFCAYHPLWSLQNHGVTGSWLDAYPHVVAWLARMRGFGRGSMQPMAAEEALALALDHEPHALPETTVQLDRLKLGDVVEICANDYALEPSTGELVHIARDELVIEHRHPLVGLVHVHFPREGYRVKPSAPEENRA